MKKLILVGAAAVSAIGFAGTANAAVCMMDGSVEECAFFPNTSPNFTTTPAVITDPVNYPVTANIGRQGIGSGAPVVSELDPATAVGVGSTATPLTFRDSYFFAVDVEGQGSGFAGQTLAGEIGGPADIDFTDVLFNGVSIIDLGGSITNSGGLTFATVTNVPVPPGGLNELTIIGTARGNGNYAGTIQYVPNAAAPEPATWAMMLLGFGAVGFGMRRRRKEGARVRFAI